MSCKDYLWKIGPYVDGELPLSEHEEVSKHLEQCPECSKTALNFRTFDELASADKPPRVSSGEWARVYASATSASLPTPLRGSRSLADWVAPLLSLAAVLTLAVLLGRQLILAPEGGPAPNARETSAESRPAGDEKTERGRIRIEVKGTPAAEKSGGLSGR